MLPSYVKAKTKKRLTTQKCNKTRGIPEQLAENTHKNHI